MGYMELDPYHVDSVGRIQDSCNETLLETVDPELTDYMDEPIVCDCSVFLFRDQVRVELHAVNTYLHYRLADVEFTIPPEDLDDPDQAIIKVAPRFAAAVEQLTTNAINEHLRGLY